MPYALCCLVPPANQTHYLRKFDDEICETTIWPSQAKPFATEAEARFHPVFGCMTMSKLDAAPSTQFEVVIHPTTPLLAESDE